MGFVRFGSLPAKDQVKFNAAPKRPQFDRGRKPMKNLIKRLWQEEEGQDLTEYGLLLVLVALAAITSMQKLASAISTVFGSASTQLTATS